MNILTPKALPWAMCLQAFQAALRIQADNHLINALIVARMYGAHKNL
jgi:hypothetical protein